MEVIPNQKNDDERVEWEHQDLASVKVKSFHGHKDKITAIHFCNQDSKIISSSFDGTCKLWDIVSGKVQQTYSGGHESEINHTEMNKLETQFLSCGWDYKVLVWDIEKAKDIMTFQFGGIVMRANFSNSNNLIVCATDLENLISIVDVRSGKRIKCIKNMHTSTPTTCCFMSDDCRIASCGMDRSTKVFDLRSDMVTISRQDHTNIISDLSISPDEHMLATVSYDKSVLVYDINSGQYRKDGPVRLTVDGHDGSISCCRFSKDGQFLISAGYDCNLIIWNMRKHERELKLQGHEDWIEAVDISTNNCWLLSGSKDHTIRIWNLEQSENVAPVIAHKQSVMKSITVQQSENDSVPSAKRSF